MQNDDGPHLRIEPQETAFELIAVGDHRLVAANRGSVDLLQLDIHPVAPQPARLIDTGADQQAMQPGIEPFRVAQRGQITPGSDQCVLHGILGPFGVPEHEPGGRVQARDRGACQLGEGVMIASPRLLHEVSLHHAPQGLARSI